MGFCAYHRSYLLRPPVTAGTYRPSPPRFVPCIFYNFIARGLEPFSSLVDSRLTVSLGNYLFFLLSLCFDIPCTHEYSRPEGHAWRIPSGSTGVFHKVGLGNAAAQATIETSQNVTRIP